MNNERKNAKLYKLLDETFMKDDPLEFLINFLHFNMSQHMIYITTIKCLIVLYLQVYNVVGIVYIFKDETRTYFQKYIPLILGQQIGIMSYVLHLMYAETFLHLAARIKIFFLPLNAAGRKTHKKILGQCILIKKLFSVMSALHMAIYCTFLPVAGDEEDIEFTVMFIKEHFSVWPDFFQGLYYVCFISLAYSSTSVCAVCLYVIFHLKFQCYLLAEYLKQISSDFDSKIEDVFYQDLIHKRLKSFVRAHNKIKKIAVLLLGLGKWSVIATAIAGALLYTALMFALVMSRNSSSYFRYILCLIGTITFTYIFTRNGQDLQDESANIYVAACECDWTYWNIQNRRSLLTILINTSKEMKMTSFSIVDLGHELILRVLRITYSMVLLLLNLNK